MRFKPTFQAAGRTISKQINDLVIIQVDKNRALGDIATKCPIIYSKVGRGGMRSEDRCANDPQDGISAARHFQRGSAASRLFGSNRKSQLSELLNEPNRLACKRER
jgi:hypothetical protein